MWAHGIGKAFLIYGLGILTGILCAFPLTKLGLSFETKFGLLHSLLPLIIVTPGFVFLIVQMGRQKKQGSPDKI